ncbi:MAG: two-component regulator propeller domain-containing protein [Chitinophagaceae bacterium]
MKHGCPSFLLVAIIIGTSTVSFAQYNTTSFYTKTYMAVDGLPDSYTLRVYQDQQKYIWIGTYSGLSRFDGKAFANYGLNNGLNELYINAIAEDDQHRIWIGSRKGLGYIQNSKFFPANISDSQNINFVYNIDTIIKNKLWAFTSKGLYELQGSMWVKKEVLPGYSDIPCRFALAKDNAIYYCFPGSLIKVFHDGSFKVIASDTSKIPFYRQFRKYNERIVVSTTNGLFELVNDRIIPIFKQQTSNKNIYSFFIDSKNRTWISTEEDGLLVSAPGNKSRFDYQVPLGSNLVSDFYEDKEQNIWLANFQGLVKVRNSFFDVLTPQINSSLNQYFNLLAKDKSIYVFSNLSGMYQFEKGLLQKRKFSIQDNFLQRRFPKEMINLIALDNNNNFWGVTRNQQIVKIAPRGKQELIYPAGKADSNNKFSHVTLNPLTNQLYFSGKSLFIYDQQKFTEYRSRQTNQPIENIQKSMLLKNGNLLVNSHTSGLWLIKTTGEAYLLSKNINITSTARLLMAEDTSQKIWLSHPGGGLICFKWENDTTLKKELELTSKNGLPNDVLEAIAIDGKNRLWAATLSGLVVIDNTFSGPTMNYIIYSIGKEQGLGYYISSGLTKLITDSDGNIWFSSNNTVIRFRTNEINTRAGAPTTHIETVQLSMKDTDWKNWVDSLYGPFMLPQKLQLPYHQNSLMFNFKGLNFSTDGDALYTHMLVGMDTSWVNPTKSDNFSVMGLGPGRYTFLVKSRRTNSEWSEPAQFSFTITPPFWQTWWFRAIGILAASLLLVFIFRTQLNRVNKRAELEMQLRNLEMKALKAQMNPHFVYNALNSIQSLVIDGKPQEAMDYIVKFSRLLRQVLNHSEKNVVRLDNEIDTLDLYIQLESLRLNYSLIYKIELEETILAEKEMIPPLIVQPFVENALWHGLSKQEGDKKLLIRFQADDHWLYCEINDNGIGRAEAAKQKKHVNQSEGPRGIDITKNRLALFNEDLTQESIQIVDIIQTDFSSGGTAITLRIKRK